MEDGGPAFPVPLAMSMNTNNEPTVVDSHERCLGGMSLRDHFAGLALQGWAAGRNDQASMHRVTEGPNGEGGGSLPANVANACYRYADAMLQERKRVS